MERIIKFRAWDKKWRHGQMREFELGDMLCDENNTILDFKDLEVMQWTGMKDKKGKDIYSGDLVRQSGTLYEIRSCVGGFECQIWKEYKNGGAEEGSTYVFSCLIDKACEIIGNIYETPELLT